MKYVVICNFRALTIIRFVKMSSYLNTCVKITNLKHVRVSTISYIDVYTIKIATYVIRTRNIR